MSQWEPPLWLDEIDPTTGAVYYVNSYTGDPQVRRYWFLSTEPHLEVSKNQNPFGLAMPLFSDSPVVVKLEVKGRYFPTWCSSTPDSQNQSLVFVFGSLARFVSDLLLSDCRMSAAVGAAGGLRPDRAGEPVRNYARAGLHQVRAFAQEVQGAFVCDWCFAVGGVGHIT